MPAPQPEQGWFGIEWNRFAEGFANLNPGSAENIRDGYAATQIGEGYQNYVSMPWESPFFVYPGNLSDQERSEMRDRMLGAPDREQAGSFGRMLNALDNVQDVIVSAALLGHLALWLELPLFGPLAPVVGGLLLAADLLAAITLLGQLLSALYQLICKGLSKGIAAAVPAMLFSKGAKGKLNKLMWNNPSFKHGFFQGKIPKFGAGPAFGLITQLPQATSTLFGYGVALGGIVGSITQGAAGIATAIQGQPVHTQYNQPAHRAWGQINRPLHEDRPADLWLLKRAAAVMATTPTILRYPEAVAPGYYFATLTALDIASHVVYRRLHGYPWQAWLDQVADLPLTHHQDVPTRLQGRHTALGLPPGTPLPWDYPGNPLAVAPSAYASHVAPAIGDGVDRWLAQNRKAPFAVLGGQMVNRLTELSLQQLLDDEQPVRWQLSTDAALLEAHALASRVPAALESLPRLWSYWQELRAEHLQRPTAKWTGEYFDAVAQRHGIKLIRFLPPDAPWPEEWVTWLREQNHAPEP